MHTAINALSNHTALALNHTRNAVSLVCEEVSQIGEAVFQNSMVLDLLTEVQAGTCAILHTECCAYIPDNSHNVSQALVILGDEITHILALTTDSFTS